MEENIQIAIKEYNLTIKETNWLKAEAYKFQFANYINNKVDWNKSDEEILEILIQSQKNIYTNKARGVQFIQKSSRNKINDYILLKDVKLLRLLNGGKSFFDIDWTNRSMSFPALSAWVSSLFPNKLYPIPMTGFDKTIDYLFGISDDKFIKNGIRYIETCQKYMYKTWELIEHNIDTEYILEERNKYNKELNSEISIKNTNTNELTELDKRWLVQDFHLFIYRNILKLYNESTFLQDSYVIEGKTQEVTHLHHERNHKIIKEIKKEALEKNKKLNCEICGFSFLDTYGILGVNFIEAHHKKPIAERQNPEKTRKEDIILVCSNCHRMLHRKKETLEINDLKKIIDKNRK